MTNRKISRPGFALIELLVVITVLTVMLGLSAAMIHMLLKLDRANRASFELAADLSRLARDFRADAHASAPLEPMDRPATAIKFSLAGGRTVDYEVRPAQILRTVHEGEKVRHHDVYRRPPRASVAIELSREGSKSFACLVIDRPANGVDDSLYRDLRIEAELGKNDRLSGRVR